MHVLVDFPEMNVTRVHDSLSGGATAETIVQMLPFSLPEKESSCLGLIPLSRVHVCKWCSHRGVNCFSKGRSVFVCRVKLSCLS